MSLRLSDPYEEFCSVARRMNLVSRVIAAQELIEEGSPNEAHGLLRDLEDELLIALDQNERVAA